MFLGCDLLLSALLTHETVNSLIFLAPISAFDQVLQEDRLVNRVEDSLMLWREIVSNKNLRDIPLVCVPPILRHNQFKK